MPISKRSSSRSAWFLAGLVLASTPAWADDPPLRQDNARARVQGQGDIAMQRLKRAMGNAKRSEIPSPALPVSDTSRPDVTLRQRAFDGVNRQKSNAVMTARAQGDIAAARASLASEREGASRRIAQALGLEQPEATALAGTAPETKAKSWVPVLFVSSSMPIAVLRNYAEQLERVGGVLAFRGMPGGMTRVEPMARLSARMLRVDPGCEGPACLMRNVQIIVDPLAFRQHAVSQVPGLAMIPGDPTQPYCERDDASARSPHVVYGDAALSGLLEEYGRLGGQKEVQYALARLARR